MLDLVFLSEFLAVAVYQQHKGIEVATFVFSYCDIQHTNIHSHGSMFLHGQMILAYTWNTMDAFTTFGEKKKKVSPTGGTGILTSDSSKYRNIVPETALTILYLKFKHHTSSRLLSGLRSKNVGSISRRHFF